MNNVNGPSRQIKRTFLMKAAAVSRVQTFGESRNSVIKRLKIPESTLRGWLKDPVIVKTVDVAAFLAERADERIAHRGRATSSFCDVANGAAADAGKIKATGSEGSETATSDESDC